MSLLDNLPHLCNIQYRTRTKGTLGGSKSAETEVKWKVPCWEQPASDKEITEYEKQGMSVSRKIYFASDPGITERHEIVITSRDCGATLIPLSDRVPLEVRSGPRPDASAGLAKLYKVMVEEVTGSRQ